MLMSCLLTTWKSTKFQGFPAFSIVGELVFNYLEVNNVDELSFNYMEVNKISGFPCFFKCW